MLREEVLNKQKVLANQNPTLDGWVSSYLTSISMFEELTSGWKQDRDYYAQFGPTIEEV